MTDDNEAAANRAAMAARQAAKAEPRSSILAPLLIVAVAILTGVYLFLTDGEGPGQPTTPMPVPHVQAPGDSGATTKTPAPVSAPQQ
jgi:hypothetical protein